MNDTTQENAKDSPHAAQPEDVNPLSLLQQQLDEKHTAYLRVLADFQNFQRRAAENEMRARDHGVSSVARAIVPVLESLDVALGHDLRSLDASKLADAVEAFRTETIKALAKCGIERVEPVRGDVFDPKLHEAVMQQAADKVEPGHIAMCLQAGYRMGDLPLRSAKVAVTPTGGS